MMSHYELRLEQDLQEIREAVGKIGQQVQLAFKSAVHAVMVHDKELSSRIILGDLPINRAIRELDARCHAFVARHLPSAGPLRFVSSVLRMNIALERIGDYAATIAREQVQLSAPPPEQVARDIDLIADQAREMLSQSLKAFSEESADMARGTKASAKSIDRTFARIFDDLIAAGDASERPLQDLFAILVMLNRISRVGDQAKNLCEETIFVATGETKAPKQYRVLFLDDQDNALTRIAVAYARRAFPESGRYSSAGIEPSKAMDPKVIAFLEEHGYEVDDETPRLLKDMRDDLADYHVIVGVTEDARQKTGDLPFQTTLLQWEPLPPATDPDEAHRYVCAKVAELMVLLRGEDAS